MHQFDNMCRSKHLNVYFPNVIDAKNLEKPLQEKKILLNLNKYSYGENVSCHVIHHVVFIYAAARSPLWNRFDLSGISCLNKGDKIK